MGSMMGELQHPLLYKICMSLDFLELNCGYNLSLTEKSSDYCMAANEYEYMGIQSRVVV
jgi:hypothetical protein